MPGRICTGFKDTDGLDVGCHLVTKEFLMESFPQLLNQNKIASLWGWGSAFGGRIATNSTVYQSSPVQTISGGSNWKSVSTFYNSTASIKTDGTLWMWGYNGGQLGDNTNITRSSPVQVVGNATNWRSVSVGGSETGAIKTDGTLWMWGLGAFGQLGDNTTVLKSSPVQTISGGSNWRSVSVGDGHVASIKTDGTLWMWGGSTDSKGATNFGKLGDNTGANKSSPVQTVAGGINWKQASAGCNHTTAIKTDGTLWAWGSNSVGNIGNNTTISSSSPVQTVSGGTNWRSVSAGIVRTAAIKTDGTLWVWGSNTDGGLGNNSTIPQSSPVQTISGGTNWKQVSSAGVSFRIAAIKTDGTLWVWGLGTLGQLGTGSTISQSSPVQTIAGGTNWRQVTAGRVHIMAIRDLDAD